MTAAGAIVGTLSEEQVPFFREVFDAWRRREAGDREASLQRPRRHARDGSCGSFVNVCVYVYVYGTG